MDEPMKYSIMILISSDLRRGSWPSSSDGRCCVSRCRQSRVASPPLPPRPSPRRRQVAQSPAGRLSPRARRPAQHLVSAALDRPCCAQLVAARGAGGAAARVAGPRERVDLTGVHGAGGVGAGAAGGGGGRGGGGARGRCGHGKQRGKCRECREGQGDGAAAQEQQANDGAEQGEGSGAGERERQRPRVVGAPPRVRRKCEHNRQRSKCKDCGGASICQHNRQRSTCKDCGGTSICQHNRQRSSCKDCGGASICQHNRRRSSCKDCGGTSICQHNRQRSTCKDCGGTSICLQRRRRRRRSLFVFIGYCIITARGANVWTAGASICAHHRRRSRCKECKRRQAELAAPQRVGAKMSGLLRCVSCCRSARVRWCALALGV